MAKLSKRQKKIREMVDSLKLYPADEAFTLLKSIPKLKFNESVDVAINLGVDAKKSEQVVKGATLLPHGTGKNVRIAVFTSGANAEAAKKAGADEVGMEDLADKVKKGEFNFDVVIASPDAMRVVGQLGQILGPRGLMPNPKIGTVTADVAGAVRNAKAGQIRYTTAKSGGIVHCSIGKMEFSAQALKENLAALLLDLQKIKPSSAKGIYLKKITVSSTMGPGILVDAAGFGAA